MVFPQHWRPTSDGVYILPLTPLSLSLRDINNVFWFHHNIDFFVCFVQRSSIRWNNMAVIDEYFPIIYENWKLSITSIYKYLLYLANIGKNKLQRILKIMVCGLSSLLSVSSNWAAPGREGKHFSFLQKKRISYHFSFLQKKMRSHHFSCPQKKRSSVQLSNFLFSSRIKSLTRYKSANICELGVVSCVAFSWLCFPHESKKMFVFLWGAKVTSRRDDRWSMSCFQIWKVVGWTPDRQIHLISLWPQKKTNYSTRYLHTYIYQCWLGGW